MKQSVLLAAAMVLGALAAPRGVAYADDEMNDVKNDVKQMHEKLREKLVCYKSEFFPNTRLKFDVSCPNGRRCSGSAIRSRSPSTSAARRSGAAGLAPSLLRMDP